jgi:hypothetical protein
MIQTKLTHRSKIFLENLLAAQLVNKLHGIFPPNFNCRVYKTRNEPSPEPDKYKVKVKFFCARHEGM